jgi:hypothetical protein
MPSGSLRDASGETPWHGAGHQIPAGRRAARLSCGLDEGAFPGNAGGQGGDLLTRACPVQRAEQGSDGFRGREGCVARRIA